MRFCRLYDHLGIEMKILITGASGFVATYLYNFLLEKTNFEIILVSRAELNIVHPRVKSFRIKKLQEEKDKYLEILREIDVVIHTAARTHILKESLNKPLNDFRQINVNQTLELANWAKESKVKRFIFISSVKVHGETSGHKNSFHADLKPKPECDYGLSKLEAENGLLKICKASSMDFVILRPVLIYGPGIKGNFKNIVTWLKKGFPLPFGKIENKRSLLGIRNFVDFITVCIEHPDAKNQIFLVSDGYDISVTELIKKIKLYSNSKSLNLKLSERSILIILFLLGKRSIYPKICGSLCVDITKNNTLLNWSPKISLDDGLKECLESELQS